MLTASEQGCIGQVRSQDQLTDSLDLIKFVIHLLEFLGTIAVINIKSTHRRRLIESRQGTGLYSARLSLDSLRQHRRDSSRRYRSSRSSSAHAIPGEGRLRERTWSDTRQGGRTRRVLLGISRSIQDLTSNPVQLTLIVFDLNRADHLG